MGKGHQLDPGTKRRSGGYKASSPSGPGARNPRGKPLEYKVANARRQRAGTALRLERARQDFLSVARRNPKAALKVLNMYRINDARAARGPKRKGGRRK